jgi:hypothetical protein
MVVAEIPGIMGADMIRPKGAGIYRQFIHLYRRRQTGRLYPYLPRQIPTERVRDASFESCELSMVLQYADEPPVGNMG